MGNVPRKIGTLFATRARAREAEAARSAAAGELRAARERRDTRAEHEALVSLRSATTEALRHEVRR